jgi:hypothetical protein
MPGRWLVRRGILACALIAIARESGDCQSVVRGRALGASSNPVAGAEVSIPEAGRTIHTDTLGHFEITGLQRGQITLMIRAVGLQPDSARIVIGGSDTVSHDFRLVPIADAQSLAAVDIVGAKKRSPIPGFDDRRSQGVGHFLDRDALEKWSDHRTSEVLATIPGLKVAFMGTRAAVATTRAASSNQCAFCKAPLDQLLDNADISAGARAACYMDVYLDGSLVYQYARTPPSPLFNVNDLLPPSIEGIEIYSSASQVPAAYNRTSSGCGVILIWSRRSG